MKTFTLVSGNKGKISEWRAQLGDKITLKNSAIDLQEIQSISPDEIIADKARRAYEQIGSAVAVEDVSFMLPRLNNLPGPFIKFWLQSGEKGDIPLHQIVQQDEIASATCTIGYFDGTNLIVASGTVHGTITLPRGKQGFGFDAIFVPNGHTKTYAEMAIAEKINVSHRTLAIKDLLTKLS